MSVLIGLLVALAALAGRGPGGRGAGALTRSRASGPGRGPAVGSRVRRGGAPGAGPDLAVVVTEVAAQLRAGADPGRAWARALGRPVSGTGAPALEDLVGDVSQAAAVVAAGHLAGVLGAPLAQVLDRVADVLAAAADAEGERRAALAGPRATARVLTGLPALGVVLGAAVGADPVGVLLGGGAGTASLLAGAVFLVTGRWWTARLVRAAARAGQAR